MHRNPEYNGEHEESRERRGTRNRATRWAGKLAATGLIAYAGVLAADGVTHAAEEILVANGGPEFRNVRVHEIVDATIPDILTEASESGINRTWLPPVELLASGLMGAAGVTVLETAKRLDR